MRLPCIAALFAIEREGWDAKVPEQADRPAGYRPTLEKSSINSSRT